MGILLKEILRCLAREAVKEIDDRLDNRGENEEERKIRRSLSKPTYTSTNKVKKDKTKFIYFIDHLCMAAVFLSCILVLFWGYIIGDSGPAIAIIYCLSIVTLYIIFVKIDNHKYNKRKKK
ncbi:hypothetical protein J1C67_14460 [Clostridium gasigenes]|uniref:hypothetical protein n=1 Tax=Clostridium gasigenes TaxID=94869 RepID=UPI0014382F3F|nr:hypothetical protein [Clostridium gasigenes]NKF05285.1 hypothetical protein [Clostridium gasigenes]QSW18740.1 hypothetical protein J1C67_14460 [Clostridium gasigenes]